MTAEYLVATYGYPAIIIGTFLEGETFLVLGGIAAKIGYLKLQWVLISAFTGSFIGDQFYFFLGRYNGPALLRSHPIWQKRAEKTREVLKRHRLPIMFGFRFMIGLRIVTPLVMGISHFPVVEFVLLNALGAALWAVIIGLLGFAFGHGLELVFGDMRHYEVEILAAVLLVSMLVWIIYMLRTKKRSVR